MPSVIESSPKIQLEMGLVSPEDGSVKNIARAMSIQHLQDAYSGYLQDSVIAYERRERWQRIADLNPEHTEEVMSLMNGFDISRRAELDVSFYGEDPLRDSFTQFTPDARIILVDILRGLTAQKGYEMFGKEEIDIYYGLGRQEYGWPFHTIRFSSWNGDDLPFDERKFPKVISATPEQVMLGVLKGNLPVNKNAPSTN